MLSWTCRPAGGDDSADDGYDRQKLLESVAYNVILPANEQFTASAAALEQAAAAQVEAAESGDADAMAAARAEAQDAWRECMSAWQREEMLQLGPAGSSIDRLGGQDLRDEIYSWPTVNTCRVDQETAEQGYDASDFFAANLVNVYGLDALEYLLFVDTSDNTCEATVPINADGTWAALDEQEIAIRRARYAQSVAAEVLNQAQTLESAWVDGFADELSHPGEGGVYANDQEAMDDLFAAMFYLDITTKDKKVEVPNGGDECGADVCLDRLESLWANHSRENVCENLEALRRTIWGGASAEEGTGFDEYLEFVGEQAMADRLDTAIDDALATCHGMTGTLRDALVDDPASVDELFAAVKEVTDILKVEFVVALSLEVPNEGAGDAD